MLIYNKIPVWHFLGTVNRQPPTVNQKSAMLKNYFKVALRNLRNNKAFASLNIAGLAIGMATAILIGLWVSDELSFDHYNPKHDRLAKIMINQTHDGESDIMTTIAMPVGNTMATKYRDLFKKVALVSFPNLHVLAIGDKKISGTGIYT
jgi:putative ABC transport system permease protein